MTELNESQVARLRYASFVVEPARIVFVETPKAACTSFKHAITALAGSDFGRFSQSLTGVGSSAMGIHDRSLVEVPSLPDLPPDRMAEVLSSGAYLRFCVVRDPFARIASAWVDRILCHSISPRNALVRLIGFPEYIADLGYLRIRFAEFVDHLYRKEAPHFSNHHWQPMMQLLLPEIVNYSMVIRLDEPEPSLRRLDDHVRARGLIWPGLPRINETPIRIGMELYTPLTARRVAEMFEEDFRHYGYVPKPDRMSDRVAALPDRDFVRSIQERNRRLSYLSLKARNVI